MNPVAINTVAAKVCLGMTQLFTKGPLRRLNPIDRAPGDRFDSKENYYADRVSNISDYRKLFEPVTRFEGRTVLELGCSSGYLLDAFSRQESFTAIGADICSAALDRARRRFGDRI